MADPSGVTVESVTDAVLGVLKLGLDAMRDDLQLIIANKAPETKHDKASRIAFITAKAGSIADGIRKVEAARAKRAELTPAIVVAYLRSCDERSRRQVLSAFEGATNSGSVLG
ncbi:MAG TPA: hypothetical protein VJU58_06105 [Microbacterium sp.]|nr:hypothetical protein [Microbacterium sp.]